MSNASVGPHLVGATTLRGDHRRHSTTTLLMLVVWELWNERNVCSFRGVTPSSQRIYAKISSNLEQWRLAGAKKLETPFGEMLGEV